MSIGRSKVSLDEQDRWVFNRMVEAYAARPAYPEALVDAVAQLAPQGGRVLDLGAGLGHLALPLAQRGLNVTAVEPAWEMLRALGERARHEGVHVAQVHAKAEELPFAAGGFDLVVVADAVHFMDRRHAGREVARVLSRRGALAVVTCAFAKTPFMVALEELMQESAPRRPRDVEGAVAELLALSKVKRAPDLAYTDTAPVSWAQLEAILGSISFIGPAMNADRTAAFRKGLRGLEPKPTWARSFRLASGSRGSSRPPSKA